MWASLTLDPCGAQVVKWWAKHLREMQAADETVFFADKHMPPAKFTCTLNENQLDVLDVSIPNMVGNQKTESRPEKRKRRKTAVKTESEDREHPVGTCPFLKGMVGIPDMIKKELPEYLEEWAELDRKQVLFSY